MKILILYYSGVGNTKMVARKIAAVWKDAHDVTVVSTEHIPENLHISTYEALVIGFPTIHAAPAKPIIDFIQRLQPLTKSVPAFLFTTCGLYSANTLRIFAKICVRKNIIPLINKSYRCSATDGTLIAPFMDIWFRHEKKLDEKIIKDSEDFIAQLNNWHNKSLPRFKLYSILNYPNKILGKHFSPTIYVHKEQCICCGKCINSCPASSIDTAIDGYPFMTKDNCIHCYRCIHHCPKKALSLAKKHTPAKTLYY